MLFCSAMQVFTDYKDWPNLVMYAYKRFQPNIKHHAEWCGEYLRVVHRWGDLMVEWKMLRDMCCSDTIRHMTEQAFKRLDKMDKIQTRL